jgi:hypothetical protein
METMDLCHESMKDKTSEGRYSVRNLEKRKSHEHTSVYMCPSSAKELKPMAKKDVKVCFQRLLYTAYHKSRPSSEHDLVDE